MPDRCETRVKIHPHENGSGKASVWPSLFFERVAHFLQREGIRPTAAAGRTGRGSRVPSIRSPDTAERNREAQHARNRCQPSPTSRARHFDAEAEPSQQQPKPQGEERRATCKRNAGCRPSGISVRGRVAECSSSTGRPLCNCHFTSPRRSISCTLSMHSPLRVYSALPVSRP